MHVGSKVASLTTTAISSRALVSEEAFLAVRARVAVKDNGTRRSGDLMTKLFDERGWQEVGMAEIAELPCSAPRSRL